MQERGPENVDDWVSSLALLFRLFHVLLPPEQLSHDQKGDTGDVIAAFSCDCLFVCFLILPNQVLGSCLMIEIRSGRFSSTSCTTLPQRAPSITPTLLPLMSLSNQVLPFHLSLAENDGPTELVPDGSFRTSLSRLRSSANMATASSSFVRRSHLRAVNDMSSGE